MREIQIRKNSKNQGKRIAAAVCGYESEVFAVINGKKYNAKSIMNMPVMEQAEIIDFLISGEDEEIVERAIMKLYGLD